jgi:hypothetical protein
MIKGLAMSQVVEPSSEPPSGRKGRLLDEVREVLRTLHYSYRTERTYLYRRAG